MKVERICIYTKLRLFPLLFTNVFFVYSLNNHILDEMFRL